MSVSVSVFKRRLMWRVECSRPACKLSLRNLRFRSHDSAVSFASGHIADHAGLAEAMLRAHAVARMAGGPA